MLVELDESAIDRCGDEAAPPLLSAAGCLAEGGAVALRFRSAPVAKQHAMTRAEAALDIVRRVLIEKHQLPADSYVEFDDESRGTPVAPFNDERFLLPHQDGGHCSFLTPSRLDYPDFDPAERTFSKTVYWKRASHKMYQGFLITDTGQPPGKTYYYNTLTLLWDAFVFQHGRTPDDCGELADFNVGNLRKSRKIQGTHQSRYLTLGGLLGSTDPAHHVMPSGPRAESELWPNQYISMPQLCDMADGCPCGACEGPGERLFCHASSHTLGRTWPGFRVEYETCLVGECYDLLIGNNLTQLHAADSKAARTIRPLCIVLDDPDSDAYERWLHTQWQVWHRSPACGAI